MTMLVRVKNWVFMVKSRHFESGDRALSFFFSVIVIDRIGET